MEKGYLVLLSFVVLFAAIVGSGLFHEYTPLPVDINDNITVSESLMSVPDDGSFNTDEEGTDEPGWWLHKGDSYVSFISDEHMEGPVAEIPEFPTVVLPVMVLIGLAFVSGRREQ